MRGHVEQRWAVSRGPLDQPACHPPDESRAIPETPAQAKPPADHPDQPNLAEKNCPADSQEPRNNKSGFKELNPGMVYYQYTQNATPPDLLEGKDRFL